MEWNAEEYSQHASYVYEYGKDVVKLLEPRPNEYILDLGCGNGKLTEYMAQSGCRVLGIDSSQAMVDATLNLGIDAQLMNSEDMNFSNEFHAVFSNSSLHWMKNPDVVIHNVHRCLKNGGRFCAELGGKNNVTAILGAINSSLATRGVDAQAYNPWYFPGKDEYCSKLEVAGFRVEKAEIFERPTTLTTDIAGWLGTFAKPFLEPFDSDERAAIIRDMSAGLAGKLKDSQGKWFADYVRLRFMARKTD